MKAKIELKIKTSKKFKNLMGRVKKFKEQVEFLKKRLAIQGEQQIKTEFYKRFNRKTGEFANKVSSKVLPNSIRFKSNVNHSSYLNDGVKAGYMKKLIGSKRPIPLTDKKTKRLIFRWATQKSMANGKWYHPGIKKDRKVNDGKGFMEAAMYKTLQAGLREVKKLEQQITK
jgi:hypothetical protein